MLKQIQKIGKSKDKRRVCLWNKKLSEAGFTIGTRIHISTCELLEQIEIVPHGWGKRKVSRVMNHGNELPVIDLKETKSLDLSGLGEIGGSVTVEITKDLIVIKKLQA